MQLYSDLSKKIQEAARRNKMQANQSRMQSIRDNLMKRQSGSSPDYGSMGAELANYMGGDPERRARDFETLGEEGRAAYADMAARQSKAGPVAGFHGMFARDDRTGQIARGGVIIGGIGGGGALGLTAAGQGLLSLMEYLQQGEQVEDARSLG